MATEVNDSNFQPEVINSDLPVLVDFWAPWCGPCRMIATAIDEISKEYSGKLKICKLNVDDAPNTASRYQVMAIPTIIIFKGGNEAGRLIGALPKSEIENKLKQFL